MTSKFELRCVGCGKRYKPPRLHCEACNGLLRAEYARTGFSPGQGDGIFTFLDWLPPAAGCSTPVGPTVYRSEGLAAHLGLSDLTIAFNGYAPEIGATNPTGSFKDFEAAPTLLYCREHGIDSLILASAGNTARAFAHAATVFDFRVVLVVPERALERLWLPIRASDAVRLVVMEESEDYALAIQTAARLSKIHRIEPEGGARNVARRDGMGTSLLEYARVEERLPDHYVQAIGSGTGGIAAWEASQRLMAAGIGERAPRLHLAQNAPFSPIHAAWSERSDDLHESDEAAQIAQIAQIDALVLANRNPPYAVPGGVRDALRATVGSTYAATNEEARFAARLFESCEGLPIGPAPAVAVAALRTAVGQGDIAPNDAVLLHVTGNNERLIQRDHVLHPIAPSVRLHPRDLTSEALTDLGPSLLG